MQAYAALYENISLLPKLIQTVQKAFLVAETYK